MLPTYLPTPKTPPPPPVGAEFNLEYGTRDGRATLEVFCSFIVSIRPAHLAPPRPSTPPTDPNTPAAAALVPVTIALLTLGCIRPLQFDCVVPIYGQPLNPGSPARGMFALDLLALKPGMPLPPGPCVAYVLIDGSVSGPRRFRIP